MRPFRLGPKILLLAGGAALLAGAELRFQFLSRVAGALDPARVETWLAGAGPLAPLLFIAVMAATVITPLPSIPLDLLAGRLFGPLAGTLYSALGATLGSLVSFQIARWLGRDFVARALKGHISFCERCSNRLLDKVVFLARLLPVMAFDLVSYGAGLTRMSAGRFAVASFLGMLPLTFLFNWAGDLVLGHRWMAWLGTGAMVALFFLLPYWIDRYDLFSLRRFFRHSDPSAPNLAPVAAAGNGASR